VTCFYRDLGTKLTESSLIGIKDEKIKEAYQIKQNLK
jgi:hypothetical protein